MLKKYLLLIFYVNFIYTLCFCKSFLNGFMYGNQSQIGAMFIIRKKHRLSLKQEVF